MVIAARTGQGKTLCFGIPMLDICLRRIEKLDEKAEGDEMGIGLRGLILSPTRELAIQIKDMIEAVVPVEHQERIKVAALVGGMSIQKQQRLLSYKPAIVVATPGRLVDFLERKKVGLDFCRFLCLDEADRMLDMGFEPQIKVML